MHTIGSRLKAWRDGEKLKQPDAATRLGVPFRSYQNYEGDVSQPNTAAWRAFARAGINANWLLTGEGPMLNVSERARAELLALIDEWMESRKDQPDLKAKLAAFVEAYNADTLGDSVANLPAIDLPWVTSLYSTFRLEKWANADARINRGALAALLRGAVAITAQGMSVEAAADMAAEMYERALQNGEITPEGVGQGSLGNAA